MEKLETLTVTDAARIAEVNRRTIYNWIAKYNIGYRLGGQWRLRKDIFRQFLNGELTQPC